MAKNKGGRKNKLSQDEREGIEKLLERADITYPTPGRRDTVYGDIINVNVNTSKKDTFCGKFMIYLVLLTNQRL